MRKLFSLLTLAILAIAASIPMQAITVYFNNPNNWTTVKAYFYKGAANNEWPGAAMTKDGSVWKIDVPAAYETGYVIFNNDNNGQQYPAATGMQLDGKSMFLFQDKDDDSKTLWAEYQSAAFKVYFDNSTENWSTVKVHYFGKTGSEWPGVNMTVTAAGSKVYEYEVPAGTVGLVFNNGSGEQSGNFAAVPEHKYNKTADLGADVPVGDPFFVYFDNSKTNWSAVKVHYFGGTTESEWPGVDMTATAAGSKVFKAQVAAGTTGLVFNNGNGEQSDDLVAQADHLYDKTGDKGAYDPSATPSVETPAALYILGNVGETFWATTPGVAMTKSGNTFTATGVVLKQAAAGADKSAFFTLVSAIGADWDAVNAHDRYGAATEDAELTSGTAADVVKYPANVSASGAKSWKIPAGEYNIVVDFATMKVTATRTDEDIQAGSGALAVSNVTIQPGKDATIQVSIQDATQKMKALQLDIELPSVVDAGAPLISTTMGNHSLTSAVVDGKLRVIIFSATNTEFSSQNGAIFYLPVTAKADAAVGTYPVKLTNIVFSDQNLLAVRPADVTGTLTVEAVATGSITLDKTVVALNPGATAQLTATVLPEDAAVKTVTWATDAPTVATVSDNGLVTAVANGTATITASCNGLHATCTVYVGKKAQTITWDVATTTLNVDQTITFSATATSGEDVEFVITNGSACATLVGNTLTAVKAGTVTVEARQAGNDTYAPAQPVSKTFTIVLGYTLGDVNGDDTLDLQDATSTVQHILGQTPSGFLAARADLNGDGVIDVVDVSLIVEAILAQTPSSSPAPMHAAALEDSNAERFNIEISGDALHISFSNMSNYIATQFDLVLPAGVEIESASMVHGTSHEVSFRNYDNGTARVVVLSKVNDYFTSNGYINLFLNTVAPGRITLNNALVNSLDGNDVVQASAIGATVAPSAIDSIEADAVAPVYYNLQGVRVENPQGGVFIEVRGNKAVKVVK